MKKPGRTRMVLAIMLIVMFILVIFQSMVEGKKPDILLLATIPVIILGILLIEFVIAKRVYPQEKELGKSEEE